MMNIWRMGICLDIYIRLLLLVVFFIIFVYVATFNYNNMDKT